jgi:hypothetical protein
VIAFDSLCIRATSRRRQEQNTSKMNTNANNKSVAMLAKNMTEYSAGGFESEV